MTVQEVNPALEGAVTAVAGKVERTFRASEMMQLEPTTLDDQERQEAVLADWEAQHQRLLAEGWQVDTYNEPRRPRLGTWFKYAIYERRTR